MKTLKLKTLIVTATILLLSVSSSFAQRGMGIRANQNKGMYMQQNRFCVTALDLSDEQQTQIDELRLSHLKNMQTNRNKMNELRARKQTLMTSDSELKEVNSVIDEMSVLHTKMMKVTAKHRKDVRSLLNDEQKIIFDSHNERGMHRGHGFRNGRGRGNGAGVAYGRRYGDGTGTGVGNGSGYGTGNGTGYGRYRNN